MSLKCISTTIHEVHGLTPTQKLVLILLSNYCDEKNRCFPSHSHIAQLAGIKSSKHISKIIRELSKRGYLTIQYRYKEDGGNQSNIYTLTLERGVLQNPLPLEEPKGVLPSDPNTKDDTKDRDIDSDFEIFWKAYPRKVNKYQAKQKYYLITKTYDKDKLKCMLDKFVAHCEAEKTETKFIPHCSTFLNQRRFLDYEDIDIKDIKSISSIKEPDWKQQKRILSNEIEKRVVATWAESNEPENIVNVDPQASQKLKAIAEKFNLKGKSR